MNAQDYVDEFIIAIKNNESATVERLIPVIDFQIVQLRRSTEDVQLVRWWKWSILSYRCGLSGAKELAEFPPQQFP